VIVVPCHDIKALRNASIPHGDKLRGSRRDKRWEPTSGKDKTMELSELQQHIRTLVTLEESEALVIFLAESRPRRTTPFNHCRSFLLSSTTYVFFMIPSRRAKRVQESSTRPSHELKRNTSRGGGRVKRVRSQDCGEGRLAGQRHPQVSGADRDSVRNTVVSSIYQRTATFKTAPLRGCVPSPGSRPRVRSEASRRAVRSL
jgi:hypothetical protein